jgi:hypothetical protein
VVVEVVVDEVVDDKAGAGAEVVVAIGGRVLDVATSGRPVACLGVLADEAHPTRSAATATEAPSCSNADRRRLLTAIWRG